MKKKSIGIRLDGEWEVAKDFTVIESSNNPLRHKGDIWQLERLNPQQDRPNLY